MNTRLLPAAVCLAVFLALAYGTAALPVVQVLDAAVDALAAPLRTKTGFAVFLWVTVLGSGPALLTLVITASALLWSGGDRAYLRPLWLVYIGVETLIWGSKYALDRARPVFLDVASASSPSFPSAHTAGAAAVYGMLALIIARRCSKTGLFPLAVAALAVASVALSRIVLGVHFFSDVLGGLILAMGWLQIGRCLLPNKRPSY